MDATHLVKHFIKEFGMICTNNDSKLPFYEIRWNDNIIHIHHTISNDDNKYLALCVSGNLLALHYVDNVETNQKTGSTSVYKHYDYIDDKKAPLQNLPAFVVKNKSDLIIRVKPFLMHTILSGLHNITTSCYPSNTTNQHFKIETLRIPIKSCRPWTQRENDRVDKLIETLYQYICTDAGITM